MDNKKNKHLVLTVVNGVANWVDVREATERFVGFRQERLLPDHFAPEQSFESHTEDLE